jgi:DNA polymerase III epsilon subunit-like protein
MANLDAFLKKPPSETAASQSPFLPSNMPLIDDNLDLIMVYQSVLSELSTEEKEIHLHKTGRDGGSDAAYVCTVRKAKKKAGIKMPVVEGLKAETGAMLIGTLTHKLLQLIFWSYYHSPEWMAKNPGIHYENEVYVKTEVGGEIIETEIDGAFVTDPGFIEEEVEFAHIKKMMPVKHPDADWVKMFDFKTASPLGFTEYLDEIPPKYRAQGMAMLKATGLSEINFLFFNKINARMYYVPVVWDEEEWDRISEWRKHLLEVTQNLILKVKEPFSADDLWFISETDPKKRFECKICELSETHEEIDDKTGLPVLVFDAPCPEAKAILKDKALEMFTVGTMWQFGSSHVTINSVEGEMLHTTNKGGKPFDVTVYAALNSFKELGAEKPVKPKKEKQEVAIFTPPAPKPAPEIEYEKNRVDQIAVVDIETTDIKPSSCIVEIGVVVLDTKTGEIKTLFDHVVREPGKAITEDDWIFRKSDLAYTEVLAAEPLDTYIAELQEIFNNYPVTAFNADFDIDKFLSTRGLVFPHRVPCIMVTATPAIALPPTEKQRKYYPEKEFKTPSAIEAWSYYFGEDYVEKHRARSDAEAEAHILRAMIKRGDYPLPVEE